MSAWTAMAFLLVFLAILIALPPALNAMRRTPNVRKAVARAGEHTASLLLSGLNPGEDLPSDRDGPKRRKPQRRSNG